MSKSSAALGTAQEALGKSNQAMGTPESGSDRRIRVGFQPSDELVNELSVRAVSATRAWVARRDLERYYTILRASVPRFNDAEAALLVHALHDLAQAPPRGSAPPELHGAVGRAIHTGRLDLHYGIEARALLARLRRLSQLEQLALLDAAERYWQIPQSSMTPAEALHEVGLVRADELYWGQRAPNLKS